MRYPPIYFLKQMNMLIIEGFMVLLVSCLTIRTNLCSPNTPSLKTLPLHGHFDFHEVHHAARDFGNRYQFLPVAVLHPKTVSDIATIVKHVWDLGPGSELTVSARGHGHSLQGQSQAHRGVVINMESLKGPQIQIHTGSSPYVDASGGELWINILFHSVLGGLGQFGIITRARISLEAAPHYATQDEWKAHFGPRWEDFAQRKSAYDPLAILAPVVAIFSLLPLSPCNILISYLAAKHPLI